MSGLFKVHKLNDTGMKKAMNLQHSFESFLNFLEGVCETKSREFSIVKTKLEETSFFAKKAMAIQSENQENTATFDADDIPF